MLKEEIQRATVAFGFFIFSLYAMIFSQIICERSWFETLDTKKQALLATLTSELTNQGINNIDVVNQVTIDIIDMENILVLKENQKILIRLEIIIFY